MVGTTERRVFVSILCWCMHFVGKVRSLFKQTSALGIPLFPPTPKSTLATSFFTEKMGERTWWGSARSVKA